MEIVVPCGGKSSRFPNLRPKYLLTDYSGNLMIQRVVKQYLDVASVTVVILEEHDQEYGVVAKFREIFGKSVKVHALPAPTCGPAETVYAALDDMEAKSPLLVRDSDSFFNHEMVEGNNIFVANLHDYPDLSSVSQKSFTLSNDQDVVLNLVEKRVVSENFCVGGYQFASILDYKLAFERVTRKRGYVEVFVSHVIDSMISNDVFFKQTQVSDYIDVGTSREWFDFNDRPTFLCDIDGVILKSKFSYDEEVEPIWENVTVMLEKESYGCKLVFVTSRPEINRDKTIAALSNLGFRDFELVMGLNHSSRVLINDFAPSNPFPSARAINIVRDSASLRDYI